MICTILWNTLSIDDWEEKFSRLPYSNLLQSYDYAKAYCPMARQKARWGLIQIDGHDAGLVQLFEAGILWNAIHAVIVDRGPLWFDGFGNAVHVKLFFDELNKQFPPRLGRRRRFLPETEDGATARKLIEQTGLERMESTKGYETIWVDLAQNEETLRANLKSNWRNKLNKAEKAGITIDWDNMGREALWATAIYAADKESRHYGGPKPELLRSYATILAPKKTMLVGRAMEGTNPIAFVILVMHGRSATYLVGWSSPEGRDVAAHHLLLWEGMLTLKRKGIQEFDLGGTNDEGAAGVKTFKEGLGGKLVRYVGHYY